MARVCGGLKKESPMRKFIIPVLLAGTAAVAGCAMEPAPVAVASAGSVCGSYGYVDVNNDGFISGDEWNTYRTGAYSFWDADYWTNYWTAFDANGDGYLSADEYWSAAAWSRIDRNGNGRIDADEWRWW